MDKVSFATYKVEIEKKGRRILDIEKISKNKDEKLYKSFASLDGDITTMYMNCYEFWSAEERKSKFYIDASQKSLKEWNKFKERFAKTDINPSEYELETNEDFTNPFQATAGSRSMEEDFQARLITIKERNANVYTNTSTGQGLPCLFPQQEQQLAKLEAFLQTKYPSPGLLLERTRLDNHAIFCLSLLHEPTFVYQLMKTIVQQLKEIYDLRLLPRDSLYLPNLIQLAIISLRMPSVSATNFDFAYKNKRRKTTTPNDDKDKDINNNVNNNSFTDQQLYLFKHKRAIPSPQETQDLINQTLPRFLEIKMLCEMYYGHTNNNTSNNYSNNDNKNYNSNNSNMPLFEVIDFLPLFKSNGCLEEVVEEKLERERKKKREREGKQQQQQQQQKFLYDPLLLDLSERLYQECRRLGNKCGPFLSRFLQHLIVDSLLSSKSDPQKAAWEDHFSIVVLITLTKLYKMWRYKQVVEYRPDPYERFLWASVLAAAILRAKTINSKNKKKSYKQQQQQQQQDTSSPSSFSPSLKVALVMLMVQEYRVLTPAASLFALWYIIQFLVKFYRKNLLNVVEIRLILSETVLLKRHNLLSKEQDQLEGKCGKSVEKYSSFLSSYQKQKKEEKEEKEGKEGKEGKEREEGKEEKEENEGEDEREEKQVEGEDVGEDVITLLESVGEKIKEILSQAKDL